jgi:hypothetical protein
MSIRLLPAPADRAFLEAFLARGYRELRVEPPWTLVAGAAAQSWRLRGGETADVVDLDGFRAFARPGIVLIATSFELEALGEGTRLKHRDPRATDRHRRRSRVPAVLVGDPWWLGADRRDVLHAVRRRAERDRPGQPALCGDQRSGAAS